MRASRLSSHTQLARASVKTIGKPLQKAWHTPNPCDKDQNKPCLICANESQRDKEDQTHHEKINEKHLHDCQSMGAKNKIKKSARSEMPLFFCPIPPLHLVLPGAAARTFHLLMDGSIFLATLGQRKCSMRPLRRQQLPI